MNRRFLVILALTLAACQAETPEPASLLDDIAEKRRSER